MKGFWIGLAMAVTAGMACAQSFNIDLNVDFGPPSVGAGVPDISFGGAADQPGFWNANSITGQPPQLLRNLSGEWTGVTLISPIGGGGTGFNNPANTGGYAALLNDGRDIGRFAEPESYTIVGLANGLYRFFTYALLPSGEFTPNRVVVSGSLTPNPQIVTGPMPGNQFIVGITHCVHELQVTSGSFVVTVTGTMGQNGYINGFQLVQVPEPATVTGIFVGSLFVLLRNRKSA